MPPTVLAVIEGLGTCRTRLSFKLTSFPGCSCLQFLIAIGMQKWRGGRNMCMTSGKQRVDMRGGQWLIVVTHKVCIDQPRVFWTMSCNDTVLWTLHSDKILHVGPLAPLCLPIIASHTVHMIRSPWPFFLPASFLHTGKRWKLDGGEDLGTRLFLSQL